MIARRQGSDIVLPGLATAHSHAFQRALRGRCQRASADAASFWSWRARMYALVQTLDPDSIYSLSRYAFAELAMSGVTAVGEFHYLHHQPGGQPYGERTAMADAVIRAAGDVGLRISLLRVVYQRAGLDQELAPGQERFCDPRLEDALADVDSLRSRYAASPLVEVGLALHSVRALTRPWIAEASRYAKSAGMPLHMHVSEQRRELEECRAEHGLTPVQLLADEEVLDPRFVAVHATHLDADEVAALGQARAMICVCRTTERDLGDGHCDARALLEAGAQLCTGVDSHAISDPFEEARAIELDQRTRDEARTLVADASALLQAACGHGYAAIGMDGLEGEDRVVLDGEDPALVGAEDALLDDAVVFAASPRAVRSVSVAGREIVRDGRHLDFLSIREDYLRTLRGLPLELG